VRVLCTGRNLRGDTRLSMKALNRAGSLDSTSSEASSPGSDSDASSSYSGEGVRRAYGVPESAPKRRITEESVEVGKTYKAQVVSIKDFGAFLELETGETGLLHVSQVAHGFVSGRFFFRRPCSWVEDLVGLCT
jgi:polyribonucleotide nucleotidyltransferase